MCCEATDALLEYVRRYLSLSGLRNLNAPRRLKLRVPVLKEWLQRQGHAELAASIPDWDPVRRPTGVWKAWEIQHLKPIMDEKAVERQAKRALVGGETKERLTEQMALRQQTNQQEALEGLTALQQSAAAIEGREYAEPKTEEETSFGLMIMDDAAEAAAEAGEEADGNSVPADEDAAEACALAQHAAPKMATDAIDTAISRAASIRELIALIEPTNAAQVDALQQAQAAVDHLTRQLTACTASLSFCAVRHKTDRAPAPSGGEAARPDAAAVPMLGAPSAPAEPTSGASADAASGATSQRGGVASRGEGAAVGTAAAVCSETSAACPGVAPPGAPSRLGEREALEAMAELSSSQDSSSQAEALLLASASQVSVSGSLAGLFNGSSQSQESVLGAPAAATPPRSTDGSPSRQLTPEASPALGALMRGRARADAAEAGGEGGQLLPPSKRVRMEGGAAAAPPPVGAWAYGAAADDDCSQGSQCINALELLGSQASQA